MSPSNDPAQRIAEYLRSQAELSSRIQDRVSAALSANEGLVESLERSLAPFTASASEMADLARSFQVPRFEGIEARISGVATDTLAQLREQTEEFHRRMAASFEPLFDQRQADFSDLPPRTRDALGVLGEHGWYLDLEMPLPALWEIQGALEAGDTDEVDEALCDYYEGRLDAIESTLADRLPRRSHLIRAAFAAHRRGEYALAIPVLLAQTDGICKDLAQGYFFLRRNRRPEVAAYVDAVASDSLRAALLSPLASPLPIRASRYERDDSFSAMNRHRVLHGEDVDYGTRRNSFKAVALVNYVGGVLTDPPDSTAA